MEDKMPGTMLASLPNSRVKPRPATSQSSTVIIPVPTGIVTLVRAANPNNTDVMLRNLSNANDIYYGYVNTIDGITTGFKLVPLDAIDLDDPGDVFVLQNSGGPLLVCLDKGEG
jgi:hypothetical protein